MYKEWRRHLDWDHNMFINEWTRSLARYRRLLDYSYSQVQSQAVYAQVHTLHAKLWLHHHQLPQPDSLLIALSLKHHNYRTDYPNRHSNELQNFLVYNGDHLTKPFNGLQYYIQLWVMRNSGNWEDNSSPPHCYLMRTFYRKWSGTLSRLTTKFPRRNSRIIQGCFKDLYMIFKDVKIQRVIGQNP